MSIDSTPAGDSRPAEYNSARFPASPLSPGLVGERVRVRGLAVELILGR